MAHHCRKNIKVNGLQFYSDSNNILSYIGSGTSCKNIVNPTQTGTLTGGVTFSNGSYDFDGINGYVGWGNILDAVLQADFSLIAWINLDTIGVANPIFSKFVSSSDRIDFRIHTTDKILLEIDTSDNTGSTTSLTTGAWYQVGVSFNSTTKDIKYYLNGSPDGTDIDSDNFGGNAGSVELGRISTDYLDGKMQPVQLYDSVLTDAEFLANFIALTKRF